MSLGVTVKMKRDSSVVVASGDLQVSKSRATNEAPTNMPPRLPPEILELVWQACTLRPWKMQG